MNIGVDHWLDTATRIELPGRGQMPVRRFLVWHHTAGATGRSSIESMKENGLSAHFVVERDGEIIQCVPCNQVAYHAGKSRWKDPNTGNLYVGLNTCSIGIEIANGGSDFPRRFSKLAPLVAKHRDEDVTREWETYPEAQLAAVEALSKVLVARYKLDSALGHEDCSRGRKTDPGPAFPKERMVRACGFGYPLPRI
jgi:N-acetylmuramoyl-L-alanine amidase